MRRVQWACDAMMSAWALSWFALYLEIYRYRHVVASRMWTVLWPAANAASKPGGFVRSVVAASLAAPAAFVLMAAWMRRRSGNRATAANVARSVRAAAAMLGAVMVALGGLNQAIRKPPFIVDFTMRDGNGGFVLVGAVLLAVGVFLPYGKRRAVA